MVLAVLPKPAVGQTDTITVADSLQQATLPALPPGVSGDDLRAGDALFHGRGGCFVCHGADGRGVIGAANALTLGVSHIARELPLIDSVITHGLRDDVTRSAVAMPARGARSDLTEAEIHAGGRVRMGHFRGSRRTVGRWSRESRGTRSDVRGDRRRRSTG